MKLATSIVQLQSLLETKLEKQAKDIFYPTPQLDLLSKLSQLTELW